METPFSSLHTTVSRRGAKTFAKVLPLRENKVSQPALLQLILSPTHSAVPMSSQSAAGLMYSCIQAIKKSKQAKHRQEKKIYPYLPPHECIEIMPADHSQKNLFHKNENFLNHTKPVRKDFSQPPLNVTLMVYENTSIRDKTLKIFLVCA